MTPERAQQIVEDAVRSAFAMQGTPDEVTEDTPIYGPTSSLDSLGFIFTLQSIEDDMEAEGVAVTLEVDGSEHYATVATMRDYLAGRPNPAFDVADGYE